MKDRLDDVLGVFLMNRSITHTTSGKPIHGMSLYRLVKDPADGKWFVLAEGEELITMPTKIAEA